MRFTDIRITVDNPVPRRPPNMGALMQGVSMIEGKVWVDFESPALVDYFRQERGRVENALLRMARPHMPRRAWQRLRGKWKARGR